MSYKKRNIVTCVILSFVTFGIYPLYWMYHIGNDLYELNNEESKAGMDVILSIVTCGIFFIYLQYKWGKMIDSARRRYDLYPRDDSLLFVILSIVGLSIVNQCIIQSQLNNDLIPAAEMADVIFKDTDRYTKDDRSN